MRIWPIEDGDLSGVMGVEQECFGAISSDAMASPETMKHRISLCNNGKHKWFLGAGHKKIVGYIILQPTHLHPEKCLSWNHATDNGSLQKTFDEKGDNVYIVSLAVSPQAPFGTTELLVHSAFAEWASSNKQFLTFCSRMPGFADEHKKSGITPEEYVKLRHREGGPRDPMLRRYWAMTGGTEPYRLLKNGFPPDPESHGHGVLFVVTNPAKALRAVNFMTYHAGKRQVHKELRQKEGALHEYSIE